MTVPTYDKFIEPILRYLAANNDGASARDVHEAAAAALDVSEADRQELLPSGMQPIYKNRAGWAHDRLKRAGLSSSPRRGFWQITEKGREFVRNHGVPLSAQQVEQIATDFMDVRLRPVVIGTANTSLQPASEATQVIAVASPDDQLGQAISELRNAIAAELLETLAAVSPEVRSKSV